MILALASTVSIFCLLTASFSVAMETVVGVGGRRVLLPCSSEAASKSGVCWGRGKPSVFGCHNTVLVTNGVQVTYSASYRYRLLSNTSAGDVSLSIDSARAADSGFYHCRVQVPGLFNDPVFTFHLIVTEGVLAPARAVRRSPPLLTESFVLPSEGPLQVQPTEPYFGSTFTEMSEESGSGEVWGNNEDPVATAVKSSASDLQLSSPETIIGNTLRVSFIIFIPALLLTIGYRLRRTQQRSGNGLWMLSDPEDNSL